MEIHDTYGIGNRKFYQLRKDLIDICEIRNALPKVGDVLYKIPTLLGVGCANITSTPVRCVVTYVNKERLWYQVQFLDHDFNFKECYKLPDVAYQVEVTDFIPGEHVDGTMTGVSRNRRKNASGYR